MVFLDSSCNTTDAELRMYSVLASYTSPTPLPPPPPRSMLLSESIEESQSFGKGVFGKLASFQCSLSALCNKSRVHSTFLPDVSAEIHLAVRKQLLFIKGRGRRNFNFKDVLNELPRCDGLALRNSPPAPLYASAGGFNYNPPELLLLASQWYASCMWVEWIFLPPGCPLRTVSLHTMSSVEKCTVIRVSAVGSRLLLFMYSLVCWLSLIL